MSVTPSAAAQVVKLKGLDTSQQADDILLTATTPQKTTLGRDKLSAVSVAIYLNNSQPLAKDDAVLAVVSKLPHGIIRPTFTSAGPIADNITVMCWTAVELRGKVTPSNYRGNVVLVRTIKGQGSYLGSTEQPANERLPNSLDISLAQFRDDDPQSGGSKGIAYDVDTPGFSASAQIGRTRINFTENAVLDTPLNTVFSSKPFAYYSAISCTSGNGVQFDPTFQAQGDNQANVGCIPLTFNLTGTCN
jgi:hypothetical protein